MCYFMKRVWRELYKEKYWGIEMRSILWNERVLWLGFIRGYGGGYNGGGIYVERESIWRRRGLFEGDEKISGRGECCDEGEIRVGRSI